MVSMFVERSRERFEVHQEFRVHVDAQDSGMTSVD